MTTPPTQRPGGNVARTVEHAAGRVPAAEAIRDGAVSMDYATLRRRAAGLAGGLRGLGLGTADVVGVLALNSHRHLTCWFGVPWGGLVLNELNTRLAVPELAFILEDCHTKALIVDDDFLATGRQLLELCPGVTTLIHAGDEATPPGAVSFDELCAADPVPLAETREDDVAGIFYTGGTTGLPKGVLLTHGNLLANARSVLIDLGYAQQDRYLHAGPMFHLADGMSTYAITWVGGLHAILRSFTPAAAAAAIETHRITITNLVPTMINLLVNEPATSDHDVSSLRMLLYGGAPMPAGVFARAHAALGCELIQLYGMTEASPVGTLCRLPGPVTEEPWRTRSRSAGVPIVGVQVEVRREDGTHADPDEVGEIWLRGPNIMAGYWQRPEETARALTPDGWYRSGDAGRFDADGYLYVVDRLKDMIVSGGENVYCAEVESALSSHPAVLEVAVFGVPHERWGEAVHAEVVVREAHAVDPDELVAHCRARIAGYKVPRSFTLRTDLLPKSGTGKVLKRELRAAHWRGRDSAIV